MSLSQVLKKYISIQSAFTCWHAPLHVCLRIGVLRVAYVFIIVIIISFPFVLPSPHAPSPPTSSFFSTRSPRWRSGERPSDAGTPFVVWQRACENTTGIFHFSRRSRAPTTASRCHVTRHSFRDTYIYTATSRLPGVALINVEAFIKAARCEYSPPPSPFSVVLPLVARRASLLFFSISLSLVSFHVPISRNG